jgi:plastocyanin
MLRPLMRTAWIAFGCGVLLASCGGSSSPTGPGGNGYGPGPNPTATPSGSTADVVITVNGIEGGMSFSPASATVKAGQTVSWKNTDSITHHVVDNGGAFDTGNITGGSTSNPIKFPAAATLNYHCAIHPSMVGTLVVQ